MSSARPWPGWWGRAASMSHSQFWRKESVIPVSFWFFSIGGGLTLFTYALYRHDPVFILGEAAGVLIYSRNLYLIWHKRQSLHRSRSS
jgi:lipid-A-disaccharide synthase-like uncharacterized protein